MATGKRVTNIEYMCRYCGMTIGCAPQVGKPSPGKCPQRKGNMPHVFIVKRKFYA